MFIQVPCRRESLFLMSWVCTVLHSQMKVLYIILSYHTIRIICVAVSRQRGDCDWLHVARYVLFRVVRYVLPRVARYVPAPTIK